MARKKKTEGTEKAAKGSASKKSKGTSRTSNVSEKSIANLHPRMDGRSPVKYMQVNVFGYDDYLYRMARYHKMTTTKYILSLIKKDKEEHEEEYESLQKLSEFDKPHRISPNRKNREQE